MTTDDDELLQARNVICEFAKKHYDGTQDGAETLNSRRSIDITADDIRKLCLHMFGYRHSFPKACLSLAGQTKPKQAPIPGRDSSKTDAMMPELTPEPVTLNSILEAITQVQTDIKVLDHKFSKQISPISDQISVSLFERENIDQLEKEHKELYATN